MIDEKQLLKNMPVSEGFENEFTDIIEEVRGSDYVFSHDGEVSASVTDSSVSTASGETATPATNRKVEEPAAAARPKRTVQPIARLADEAPKPQLAKSDATTDKIRRKVMIPRSMWPRYPSRCTPCLVKSENSPLEKFCPGSPFEPSFSPRRGLLLCSTIR